MISLSDLIVLPTGTYPQDYIGLEPMKFYNTYYRNEIFGKGNLYKSGFETPPTVNVNAPVVFEYWEEIPNEILPKPILSEFKVYVSSLGRIYSTAKQDFKSCYIRKDGYIGTTIAGMAVPVHRIVLYTFCPHPDFKRLTVNHKSFNPTENYLWNLEWCTMKENKDKSKCNVINDAFLPGELNRKAVITNEQADLIGRMLQTQEYNFYQIANFVGTNPGVVKHVKMGECRKDIAEKYNLKDLDYTRVNRRSRAIIPFGPM